MKRPAKFEPGAVLSSMDEIMEIFEAHASGCGCVPYVFIVNRLMKVGWTSEGDPSYRWGKRLVHIAVAANMPFQLCVWHVQSGRIRHAVISQAYKEWLEAEYREAFRVTAMIGQAT